jgi:hypothetical protein
MDVECTDDDAKPAAIETKPKAAKGPFDSKPRTDHPGPRRNESGNLVRATRRKVCYDPIWKGQAIPSVGKMVREGHRLRVQNKDGTYAGYDMVCGGTSGFHQRFEGQYPKMLQWIGYRDGQYFSKYLHADSMTIIAGANYGPLCAFRKERKRKTAPNTEPTRRSDRIAGKQPKQPRRSARLQKQL